MPNSPTPSSTRSSSPFEPQEYARSPSPDYYRQDIRSLHTPYYPLSSPELSSREPSPPIDPKVNSAKAQEAVEADIKQYLQELEKLHPQTLSEDTNYREIYKYVKGKSPSPVQSAAGPSKEKSHKCGHDGCDKAFAKPSHLQEHQRTHTGEKPYPCTYEGCSRAFAHHGKLMVHERAHTNEKPFSCTYEGCNKAFARKEVFTKHQMLHTGIKPFSCEVCNKTFAQKTNLIVHQRIHTGVKPFSCEVCNRTFTNKCHLIRHQNRKNPCKFSP
ncbi:MAG: hypothetical protein EOP34_08235 [Rickettsiales bacterium]|nr:MAG: hypothetical protein EOP34_08235 [Rickettsiales bacterium]